MKVKVVFRKMLNGEIIAIFPEIPSSKRSKFMCDAITEQYEHVCVNARIMFLLSSQPSEEEVEGLRKALEIIGYELDIKCRVTEGMFIELDKNLSLMTG